MSFDSFYISLKYLSLRYQLNSKMKKFLFITLVLTMAVNLQAQELEELDKMSQRKGFIPKSIIDASVGIGPNFGIFGMNLVVGSKGTGLLVGVGSFDGYTTSTIGFQLSIESFFFSIARGAYGSFEIQDGRGRVIRKGLLEGTIIQTGARIGMGQKKRGFLLLSIGYAGGDTIEDPVIGPREENGFSFGLGLGYRIGRDE